MTTITALWRYPVKSMQGELLTTAPATRRGIVGDRHWAVVDCDTGKTLTARREPALLYGRPHYVDLDTVEIELPDGTIAQDDRVLSTWLGHAVTLIRADSSIRGTYESAVDFEHEDSAEWVSWNGPPGRFHDSARAAVSIVGAESLGAWDVRRFRPNVVVSGAPEDGWIGSTIESRGVRVDIVEQIGRCVMTTRPQLGGIERDVDLLRTVIADRRGRLGVGGPVQRAGSLRVGDEVRVVA